MALFREHVTVGAIAGAVGVVLLYFYAFVTDPILLVLLFITAIIGSFLPDLDSDSGVPFHVVFGLISIGAGAFALYATLKQYHSVDDWYIIAGIPVVTFLFTWVIVGGIFKHFTHHRGIMHSIPAMAIVGALAYLGAKHVEQGHILSLWFAAAAALGFATHLILDEVHSEVNFDGIPFIPKRSLGTALKLFSDSKLVNVITYSLLALLTYLVTLS